MFVWARKYFGIRQSANDKVSDSGAITLSGLSGRQVDHTFRPIETVSVISYDRPTEFTYDYLGIKGRVILRNNQDPGREVDFSNLFYGKFEAVIGDFRFEANSRSSIKSLFKVLGESYDYYRSTRHDSYRVEFAVLFIRSCETGVWYACSSADRDMWDPEIFPVPIKDFSHLDKICFPRLDSEKLEAAYNYLKDNSVLKSLTKVAFDKHFQSRREEVETEEREKGVREGFIRFLSQTLVDNNFVVENEDNREKIISLVINGGLELEGLNVSSLGLQEVIQEILNRIPEDQKEAFLKRTKEYINVDIDS